MTFLETVLLHPVVDTIVLFQEQRAPRIARLLPTFLTMLPPLVPNLKSLDYVANDIMNAHIALSKFILAVPLLEEYHYRSDNAPSALAPFHAALRLKILSLGSLQFDDTSFVLLPLDTFPTSGFWASQLFRAQLGSFYPYLPRSCARSLFAYVGPHPIWNLWLKP